MAIRVSWGMWNHHFEGKGRSGSAMAPFERAMVVCYRLSIMTVAVSVTIRPQFAIECLRRSNLQGVGHFGPKFPGVPLGVDPRCLGLLKLFRKNSNLCHHNPSTDRRTDDMRSQDRALHCSASRGKNDSLTRSGLTRSVGPLWPTKY